MVDAARKVSLFEDGRGCFGWEAAVLLRVDELSLLRLESLCHFRHVSVFSSKF